VDAPGYADPFVLVRIGEDHWAAAVGTCPVDLSDLLFSAPQDRLWCPSCGSQWRMDGIVLRGPTRIGLQSVHVDVLEGVARLLP
jgi:Rieske Fe-S protein